MTRTAAAFLSGLLATAPFAQSPSSGTQAAPDTDRAQIVEALRTVFVAATHDDLALFHRVTAPTFYAFDGGKRFEGDGLMDLIRQLHAAGSVYVWSVNDPEVHLEGATAWVTYTNRGSLQNAAGRTELTWLESAVLHKDGGTWRIQFLHSTRAAKQGS